jgi:uncharacterized protein
MNLALPDKLNALRGIFEEMEHAVIAYSGGVDSTFLLKVAVETLGARAVGLTAISESYPTWELQEARDLAESMGARIIEIKTDEIERGEYRKNAGDRCYFCKTELFSVAAREAKKLNLGHLCYGAIPDDLGDHRPGMTAADEWQVRAPLIEAGLSKDEIRLLSKQAGLPTWNKPATACLASRFPFGTEITAERLQQVEACEDLLRALGFREFRARYHEHLVRLELGPEELQRVFSTPELRDAVTQGCKDVGFRFVTIDLEGYRSGSANGLVTILG